MFLDLFLYEETFTLNPLGICPFFLWERDGRQGDSMSKAFQSLNPLSIQPRRRG